MNTADLVDRERPHAIAVSSHDVFKTVLDAEHIPTAQRTADRGRTDHAVNARRRPAPDEYAKSALRLGRTHGTLSRRVLGFVNRTPVLRHAGAASGHGASDEHYSAAHGTHDDYIGRLHGSNSTTSDQRRGAGSGAGVALSRSPVSARA